MKLSIIIPAYNEAASINTILEKVLAVVLPPGLDRELIVVDDGSTDGTASALAAWKNNPKIRVIHQDNQGKAGAIATGMKNAQGDIWIIQDADLEYNPAQYPLLLRPILEGRAQVVYGSRFKGKIQDMFWVNRWANDFSNMVFYFLYGVTITDINTCYKVFNAKALEGIELTTMPKRQR